MKKFLLGPVLGLIITISGLTAVTPVNAFTLQNYQTGLCLGVAAGNPNPGAALVTWPCDGTPSQQWGYNSRGAAFLATTTIQRELSRLVSDQQRKLAN